MKENIKEKYSELNQCGFVLDKEDCHLEVWGKNFAEFKKTVDKLKNEGIIKI